MNKKKLMWALNIIAWLLGLFAAGLLIWGIIMKLTH
jgi:hypothetical protein